jgi:hypothetical protein
MIEKDFDLVTRFISSPPGIVAVGGVLFYGIQKFFGSVEEKLNDDTKSEIAKWLVGVRTKERVLGWQDTFSEIFSRLFGTRLLSWKSFYRSLLITLSVSSFMLIISIKFARSYSHPTPFLFIKALCLTFCTNLFPDYLSLFKTQMLLRDARGKAMSMRLYLLVLDLILSSLLYVLALCLGYLFIFVADPSYWGWGPKHAITDLEDFLGSQWTVLTIWFIPAFFGTIWLALYACSGLILKFAGSFDAGLFWFNRLFDLRKKPLQSIGMVAAILCTAAYWAYEAALHVVAKS